MTNETYKQATRLIKNTELQKRLGMSDTMLYRLRRSGELPFVEISGRVFYDVAEVEAFLDRKRRCGK